MFVAAEVIFMRVAEHTGTIGGLGLDVGLIHD